MAYKLEDCSLYVKKTINKTPIIMFQDHNMALPVWGTVANTLKQSLGLITFDFHADTHDAFAAAIGPHDFDYKRFEKDVLKATKHGIDNFCFEDVFKIACSYVANDEHILTAYLFKYINKYHIFCALPQDELVSFEREDRIRGADAFYHSRLSIKNMDDKEIHELCEKPYILDFDLDYFTSRQIIDSMLIKKLSILIQKATVITIAREPHYFDCEKTDESFQNEEALHLLLDIIDSALATH